MPDAAELGRAITDQMAATRTSQRELSERSGVSVSTLRNLQHGVQQRRNPATLAAVSKALGWPENYLRDLGKPVDGGAGSSDIESRVTALEGEVRRIAAVVDRQPSRD